MWRSGRERGATLIEASLVLPIMIGILIGTLETGIAFKDYLTVSYATREGSRVGALAGDDANSDCNIVHAIFDSLGQADLDDFKTIQIYAADPTTGDPVPSKVNTWTLKGVDPDPYDCANDWTIDENWPATSRNVIFGAGSQLDIIGVRVVMNHDWITGFPPFSGSFDVDESVITRIEPEAFE